MSLYGIKCHSVEMLDHTVGGKRHTVEVELSLIPMDLSAKENALEVSLDADNDSIKIPPGYSREELLSAIKTGVENACVQGTSCRLCACM